MKGIFTLLKMFLSIAGVVLIVTKIFDSMNNDQYKFEVDSLFDQDLATTTKKQPSFEEVFYN